MYDVALSFAGEDRAYVDEVAAALRVKGVRFFYDEYERVTLWGKDLYSHLRDVYQKQARFTVLFISQSYRDKVWTNHERQSAQARALTEAGEYILPVRFDDAEVPGLLPTTGYLDARRISPSELAQCIQEKVALLGQSPATAQSKLSSPALRDEALALVRAGRESLERYNLENTQALFASDAYSRAVTEEERRRAWDQRTLDSMEASRRLMASFERDHKVRAILLRDELLLRLPAARRDKRSDLVYEHPTNPLGVREVLDDLERLALRIPIAEAT